MASAKRNHPAPREKARKNQKKQVIKTVVIVAIIVALVGGVITAVLLANRAEYRRYAADRKVVATCNGYDILYEELRFVTLFYKDMLADTYGTHIWDDPATAEQYRAELEELVHDNLNQNYIVLSTCRNLGIVTEGSTIDDYVDDQMAELKDSFGSKDEYRAWLDEHWMTEHYMRFSISVSYLESAIHYTLLDNNLYSYTTQNIGDFIDFVENSGHFVRTIHVYIENVDGEDPAENLAKAQAISDELQAIEDPNERRSRMSEYIGSSLNDDLHSVSSNGYYFTQREMDETYEEAAFGLEIGEVSEPIVCSGGNFVMMRLALESDYIMENVQTLLNNYHSVSLGIYEEQFIPDCTVTFNDYGKSIDLVAMQ